MTTPQVLAGAARQDAAVSRARILVPSFSDLFFAALIVWLFLAGSYGWTGLLGDGDTGWHIRTGEYILDHHAVPRRDLYSFSKPDAPWFAWEWLADVIDGALFRAAGLKGVVLAAGILIAVFGTILIRRMMWRGAHLFIALVVALLGVGASSVHFLARPHVFTLVLLSMAMWLIEADRERASARIWWLVPLTIVWTNLHGGFLSLIAVLGIAAVGAAIEGFPRRTLQPALRYGALGAACAAASLINPYGFRLHQHAVEYLQSDWIRSTVQEFQSPSFRNENMMQFEVLLFAGAIAAGMLFRKRRIVEALWILVFAHLALGSTRHVPVYAIVAAPVVAAEASEWWRKWTANAPRTSPMAIVNQMSSDFAARFQWTSLWPAAAVLALILIGRPIAWPADFPDEIFPVAMVHAHQAEIFSSRTLTTDQWADYLIFVNPSHKVFVDGRSDFYGPEIGDAFLHLVGGQPGWRKTLDRYGFRVVLLPRESALAQLLQTQPDWRVVEEDGKRILLDRRATSVPATGNPITEPRF